LTSITGPLNSTHQVKRGEGGKKHHKKGWRMKQGSTVHGRGQEGEGKGHSKGGVLRGGPKNPEGHPKGGVWLWETRNKKQDGGQWVKGKGTAEQS